MDSKLASYFATLKEGRGGRGAARAARDELINFKMRVAGLVEAFCKRVGAEKEWWCWKMGRRAGRKRGSDRGRKRVMRRGMKRVPCCCAAGGCLLLCELGVELHTPLLPLRPTPPAQVPASPLLPAAAAPLLAGLASASRPGGHQALAERLSGLITNKLCGCKAEAAGVSG